MRRILIVCLAAFAAAPAFAKPKPPAAPPPETATVANEFENDDARMGEEIEELCLDPARAGETYDGLDNLYIAPIADGGEAFVHFAGGCAFNRMMFADSVAPEAAAAGRCLKRGDALVFADSFGGVTRCVIRRINRWHKEKSEMPTDPY